MNKTDHEKIWQLYLKKYYGMNITFFCEKLWKNEKTKVSEGLVRLIFKEHDDFSVQAWHRTKNELRKKLREMKRLTKQQKEVLVQLEAEPYVRTTHPTQPRSKYFGEELQMDASIHLWFGTRKCALHTAIDDATGMIVGAYFDWQETRNGYYQITRQFLTKYGLPLLIKTDKRTVFEYKKKNDKDMAEDTIVSADEILSVGFHHHMRVLVRLDGLDGEDVDGPLREVLVTVTHDEASLGNVVMRHLMSDVNNGCIGNL